MPDVPRARIPLTRTAPARAGSIDLSFIEKQWDAVGARTLDVACHYETHLVRQVKTTVREYRRAIERQRRALDFALEQEFYQQETVQ